MGADAVLEVDLFSAARSGCDRLGAGIAAGSCQPIHTVRTALLHDRASRAGDRACSQIVPPGRGYSDRRLQHPGARSTLGKSQRWCSLRALSFVLPAVRNATHSAEPVVSRSGPETGPSGFQTGELFATLGTVRLRPRWGVDRAGHQRQLLGRRCGTEKVTIASAMGSRGTRQLCTSGRRDRTALRLGPGGLILW